MRLYLPIIVALGLLAFVACNDGDESPAATDTPALEATATAVTEPTGHLEATATPPRATPTQRPDLEGPCPIDDEGFCDFAGSLESAIRLGQLGAIVANSELASQTCSGLEQIGPCFGMDEGFVLSGYSVGIDASGGIFLMSGEEYLSVLQDIARTNDAASDEFGDGAWRLIAIVDVDPGQKVLVTTSIGPDPIYGDAAPDRRVFLFWLQRTDGDWQISILLTTVFIEQNLTGLFPNGSPFEAWLPWGEE